MRRFLAFCPLLLVAAGAAAPPAVPVITEPAADGQVVSPADVHMEAWSYSDPDGNPHASSDVEIWKVVKMFVIPGVWRARSMRSCEAL